MIPPNVEDIDRIARLNDPILRNLQITQCYHELSECLAERNGFCANWCTFATWASRQAGQTIRREDLIRAFEERFFLSPEISVALEDINAKLVQLGVRLQAGFSAKEILQAFNPAAAFARASDAVARGNKKVFEEIGFHFARFLQMFRVGNRFDRDQTARFCAGLRPGEPPDGQQLLREAFAAYSEAPFQDGKQKSELMLLANIAAGYHEQIRLQPEIAEALNASIGGATDLKHNLLNRLVPLSPLPAALLTRHTRRLDAVFVKFTGGEPANSPGYYRTFDDASFIEHKSPSTGTRSERRISAIIGADPESAPRSPSRRGRPHAGEFKRNRRQGLG